MMSCARLGLYNKLIQLEIALEKAAFSQSQKVYSSREEKQKGHETQPWNMTVKASKTSCEAHECSRILFKAFKNVTQLTADRISVNIDFWSVKWYYLSIRYFGLIQSAGSTVMNENKPLRWLSAPNPRRSPCFCSQCVQNAVPNIPSMSIMFFVEWGLLWLYYFMIFSTILLDFYDKRVENCG